MGQEHFWNERYAQQAYAYGILPNEYLKAKIKALNPGTILLPAEGEGRNAVFAALSGWKSEAFDQSEEGKNKALLLAENHGAAINYIVSGVEEAPYAENSFDALALIYGHFPAEQRRAYHRKLSAFLKPGGHLIMEGFSKEHASFQNLNSKAGGPRDLSMLYGLEELKEDFSDFEFTEAIQQNITLAEGEFHQGEASVIRIFAFKK